MSTTEYMQYLHSKQRETATHGFHCDNELPSMLHDWQRGVVMRHLLLGRSAIFADCGLGKTFMQLAWAEQCVMKTGTRALILCPLAVGFQTVSEAKKLGITVPIKQVRSADEMIDGINVCNYEMADKLDLNGVDTVVLDESSILKSFMGKTKRWLCDAFRETPFRLACTATPSPNDHMELGNHADFLGVMASNEMLSRWFLADTSDTGTYRLKGHARADFWSWVRSWASCISKPSDVGGNDEGYILPKHEIRHHQVTLPLDEQTGEDSFLRQVDLSATGLHKELRITAPVRAQKVKELLDELPDGEPAVLWCQTNYEADELKKLIPDAVEVRGDMKPQEKERFLEAFTTGEVRRIITKPSLAGFGLNWQHCAHAFFVGLSYSYEEFYQATKRIHRFGQIRPVTTHVVLAETEHRILDVVAEKALRHDEMIAEMAGETMADAVCARARGLDQPITKEQGRDWTCYHGDCMDVMGLLDSGSVDFSVYSPPFANLYIYSDSIRDLGNCSDYEEFWAGYDHVISELHRITRPGRLTAVHCKDLVRYKARDGVIGVTDFRGELIRRYEKAGWVNWCSPITIWKDPVIEMQRTKSHGLLYKNIKKDSSQNRTGLPEYLCIFKRWPQPGEEDQCKPIPHKASEFPLDEWQRLASPVWMDIRQTRVLNSPVAREDRDEKHICPLQLDVIERALRLWSAPGDVVFSPFTGIGSEGVSALRMGRKFIGSELKEAYWKQACRFLRDTEMNETAQASLLDNI